MKLGSTLLDGYREVVAPEGEDDDAGYRARLLLLTVALALDYADRACVGALGPDLQHEFAIGNTGFGLLASAFAVAGGLATVPAGILTDRARRTLVLGASMLLWTVAMGATGAAVGFATLLGARIFLGAVTATARPTIASITGDVFHPGLRARALGLIDSGELVGNGAGFLLAGIVAAVLSWRSVFWLLGALGAVAAVFVLRLREPARTAGDAAEAPEQAREIAEQADDEPLAGLGLQLARRTYPRDVAAVVASADEGEDGPFPVPAQGNDGGVADEDDEILGFDRRKALLAVGLAVLLAAGAFALLGKLADYGELKRAVERADRAWLPLALGGEVLAYAGYILAYRDVARADGGPRLSLWTVTRVVALGFGAFVVGSSAGGLAVDFWALKRTGLKAHEAARRVLALNTFEWGVLAWLAAGAAIAVLAGRGEGAPPAMTLGWIVVIPVCTLAAAWVSQPGRIERLAGLGGERRRPRGFAVGPWARWLWDKAETGLADAIGGVGLVRHMLVRPRRHLAGLLGFPLYWAGDLITVYAGLRAFGGHISPTPLILAYATAYVLTALPLPAGGAGSMEAVLALSLRAVGVPWAPALLAAFLYRAFAFWLPILPALALLPSVGRLADDLPRTRE